jgi:hypothetical protein
MPVLLPPLMEEKHGGHPLPTNTCCTCYCFNRCGSWWDSKDALKFLGICWTQLEVSWERYYDLIPDLSLILLQQVDLVLDWWPLQELIEVCLSRSCFTDNGNFLEKSRAFSAALDEWKWW